MSVKEYINGLHVEKNTHLLIIFDMHSEIICSFCFQSKSAVGEKVFQEPLADRGFEPCTARFPATITMAVVTL